MRNVLVDQGPKINFPTSLASPATFPVSVSWQKGSSYAIDDAEVIVYVQENDDSPGFNSDVEIFQVKSTKELPIDEPVLNVQQATNRFAGYTLFPNPMSLAIDVQFDLQTEVDYNWSMVNAQGIQIEKGNQNLPIDCQQFPAGMYYFVISNEQNERSWRKLVIIH